MKFYHKNALCIDFIKKRKRNLYVSRATAKIIVYIINKKSE